MIDFEILKIKTQEFIDTLFPDFCACYNIYHDTNLDSFDEGTMLAALLAPKADTNIENFKFETFINETSNIELFNYIKTFLPEKFKNTSEIIFNTLAKRILSNMYKNERKVKDNEEFFKQILEKELEDFINLVKNFTEYNNYYFYSHDLKIKESLLFKPLTKDIIIINTSEIPQFLLQNIDYNYRIYQNLKPTLVKALGLIFNKKFKISQYSDSHTIKLKNYGCEDPFIYPISDNSSYLASPYHHQLFSLGSQILIDEHNYEMIYELLTPYMQIIDSLVEKDDYKNVAMEFYCDSLEKYGIAKITYAVIAIEALFNTGKDEITKTVVQRGLKILQNYYAPEFWELIEKDLKDAYDVRSRYAHGISRKYKKATYELSERISEYSRIILLTFLFIAPKVFKLRKKENEKSFINKKIIDKSLFYPEINVELQNLLKDLPIKIKELNEQKS